MKKRVILSILAVFTVGSMAVADLQSPPGHKWNWSRKLSRAIANLAYGSTEYISVWQRTNRSDGVNAAFSDALVEGTKRTIVRAGYGVFELVTFPVPAYKCTYRPPYAVKQRIDPWWGYEEFPPTVGIISQAGYGRTQCY